MAAELREGHSIAPPESDSVAEAARRALEAVQSLPEAYRETLILRLVEGMSGEEIAARTGLSPGSVRVNLHRGMKMLREKLGEGGVHA
jgi:RNA polymerase sigma-70 factor, ECF subfamily